MSTNFLQDSLYFSDYFHTLKNIDDVVLVNGQLVTIKEDSSSNREEDEQMKLCNSLLGHSNYFGYYRRERILLTTHLTANNVSICVSNYHPVVQVQIGGYLH